MQVQRSFSRRIVVSLALMALLGTFAGAKTPNEAFPTIKIKNFGQMDERFYRGAQPKEGDYLALAALGIKTVIDLRDNPTDYEAAATQAAGMKYVNIPMSDKDYPKEETIKAFLALVDDPNTGAFYVHCAGGRHRTGVMGAVYRFTKYGWNFDQVYSEMKNYDFYTRWGHGAMKKYVEDYAQRPQPQPVAPTVAVTTTVEVK